MTPFHLLAKSLQINGFRSALVATIVATITANSTALLIIFDQTGRLLLTSASFIFMLIAVSLIMLDLTWNRSENINIFKALGAKKRLVTTSLFFELVTVSLAGGFIGSLFGIYLASTFSNLPYVTTISPIELLQNISYILISCMLGIGAGVAIGVHTAWKR